MKLAIWFNGAAWGFAVGSVGTALAALIIVRLRRQPHRRSWRAWWRLARRQRWFDL